MKKIIIISFIAAFCSLESMAQTSLQSLLSSVEKNNPKLQTASKNLIATSASLKMGRNPADPELEYSHMFGNESSNELTLKQSFDFPTVYRQRNNIAKLGSEKAQYEFFAIRQDVFSEVTTLYVSVVAINNELAVAKNRLQNALKVKKFYEQKLAAGETTILEKNKVTALYINARSQVTMLEMEQRNLLNTISQMNGGNFVSINTLSYPDFNSIESALNIDDVLSKSYTMKAIQIDSLIANTQLKLSKQEWIPQLSVGYKAAFGKGSYNNGVVAGISIPLWQKRGNVKYAKANKEVSLSSYKELYSSQRTELQNLASSIQNYLLIFNQYSEYLSESSNEELLLKALENGTITMTEYLVELSLIYDTVDLANNAQKSLYLSRAQLTKYLNREISKMQ